MNEIDLENLENSEQEALLVYAKDELGLTVPSNIGKAKLIVKINQSLGIDPSLPDSSEDETDEDGIDYIEDEGIYDPNLKKGKAPLHNQKNIKKITINIPESDKWNGSEDVQLIIQGKIFLIKRGVDVPVPYFIVDALKNAVEKKYKEVEIDGVTINQERKVPSYPFSIVG